MLTVFARISKALVTMWDFVQTHSGLDTNSCLVVLCLPNLKEYYLEILIDSTKSLQFLKTGRQYYF